MKPPATGIAGDAAAVHPERTRRRLAMSAVAGVVVFAGVVLAEVVVTGATARTATVEASVAVGGPAACLRTATGQLLCLGTLHTSHLRLGGLAVGQCVELTYQGSQPSAVTLTGAWTRPCPVAAP